ncbi:hypothetical protein [Mycetocola zhadangensis]|uniref:Uncharacterized protein n=1 Tax=Mycetocola zhadangensis TaxID=1164595 RepID=A0A3L7J3X8_9MICO|nr:hypothetical protein [Mycetocola zhadangensis]RLQ85368.1 hypothetical protein D9V28_00270 [Mycetocola zhadangensis]GGE81992.1 hypothetical protein GCM10011313_00530 [Mycetocola zhadangensis]
MSFPEITGDPSQLKVYATRYLNLADAIQNASATLKAVGENSDGNRSKAVDEIRVQAKKSAESIGKAERRYRTTATALSTYATALEDAQAEAAEARVAHEGASQNHAAAQAKADEFADKAAIPGEAQAADSHSQTVWSGQASTFAAAASSAQSKYDQAVAKKEAAGNVAANAIEAVVSDDDLSDSWWDHLVDWVEKWGDWIAIVALLLSWVPILGQILLAVSALISIIKLIDSLMKFTRGEMSLGEVIGAAVGVVLSLIGGKAIMAAIKGIRAARSGRALSRANAARDNVLRNANAQTPSRPVTRARNLADRNHRENMNDLRNTFAPKTLGKELLENATKPFTDFKDAFKGPEASEFLRSLAEGKNGKIWKLLQQGDVTDFSKALQSMDWSDMPPELKAEVILEGAKVFGEAAETIAAPFTDVPLTIDSLIGKGTDAVTSSLSNSIDAR